MKALAFSGPHLKVGQSDEPIRIGVFMFARSSIVPTLGRAVVALAESVVPISTRVGAQRPLNEPDFRWRRWDYFGQHLMGATAPDTYETTRPPDATTPGGANPDDDDPSSWR